MPPPLSTPLEYRYLVNNYTDNELTSHFHASKFQLRQPIADRKHLQILGRTKGEAWKSGRFGSWLHVYQAHDQQISHLPGSGDDVALNR